MPWTTSFPAYGVTTAEKTAALLACTYQDSLELPLPASFSLS